MYASLDPPDELRSCVLPPWPNGELICMYPPLGSNQRAEIGPAPSRVPPSWSPSRESKLCTPPLAKRRADLHVSPSTREHDSTPLTSTHPSTSSAVYYFTKQTTLSTKHTPLLTHST